LKRKSQDGFVTLKYSAVSCHASEGWHPNDYKITEDASLRWHDIINLNNQAIQQCQPQSHQGIF